MTAMYFLIYRPADRLLQFIRTSHPVTVKQLRRLLNLPISAVQIFPMNQQKYNYLKEVLNEIHI